MSFGRAAQAIAVTLALVGAPKLARADQLSRDETTRLNRGDTITREQTVERGDTRYVGGVTYTMLDASEQELDSLLDDVNAYRRVLPKTKSARVVGRSGGDLLIELRQGTSLFETTYTIRVRKDAAKHTVRFWLDHSRPHGIDDAWGFFRVERAPSPPSGGGAGSGQGRVLLTYGALVDMGDGLGRAFFEERVRSAMLSVPQRLRGYLAELRTREPRAYTMR